MSALRLLASWVRLTLLAGSLAACVPLAPAEDRPHLSHTPGAFVVVTSGQIDAGVFQFEHPPSWRVVKGSPAAVAQLKIVLVAPDGGTVTLTELEAESSAAARFIRLGSGAMLEVLIEPADQPAASFTAQAERIFASISG